MKKVFILLLLLLVSRIYLNSQIIYSTNYKYDADIVVYVTDYKYDADLIVYKCDYKYDAEGNNGLWYFTEYK
ncbi:MAG TPA: DUF6150 family protein, partial [Bacteroidales bacterium]|nr:DUF6150 family protein [Bacteroidales bacterium]